MATSTKRVMRRRAADNPYFHRDFHGVLSAGMLDFEACYGPDAVRAFLRRFAHGFHAPLRQAMCAQGLTPLRAYLERIYSLENADFTIAESVDSLTLDLAADPALLYLQANDYPVAPSFHETSGYLYEALCEATPWAFERTGYDAKTGACRLHFFRRSA